MRRQVCKRIDRRITELNLRDLRAYRSYLQETPGEWKILDHFCRITISRFYRDRRVFNVLGSEILPALAHSFLKQPATYRVWSAGCASGEEPYTISILWHQLFYKNYSDIHPEIIATDIDPVVLARARNGCFPKTSLRELPSTWQADAFIRRGDLYSIKNDHKDCVHFLTLDIRNDAPDGYFQMILCRNLAFTYFETELQRKTLQMLYNKLDPGGILIIGSHETLPANDLPLRKWHKTIPIYQKVKN